MRVFVTGASGFIGSAVVAELLGAGHEVTGLARSDASAEALQSRGVTVQRGDLDDLDGITSAAGASDGVIHLGFKHDFSDMASAGATERAVVTAIGDTLAGSDRPFLFASGIAGIAPGTLLTEDVPAPWSGPEAPRGGAENLAFDYVDKGVRSISLRFAPTVHGEGDHGFIAFIAGQAAQNGVSPYIGDGSNRWPAVNRADAARMVLLGLEKAPAGSKLHAVGEEGIETKQIAETIGRGLDLPVTSISAEDAPAHFQWMAQFFAIDMPASSAATQELLGWTPTHPGLIADLEAGYYFH